MIVKKILAKINNFHGVFTQNKKGLLLNIYYDLFPFSNLFWSRKKIPSFLGIFYGMIR